MPVKIPGGVKVEIEGTRVSVKGPKGELEKTFPDMLTIQMQEGSVVVARPGDAPSVRALHGMTRAMINNMVRADQKKRPSGGGRRVPSGWTGKPWCSTSVFPPVRVSLRDQR
jgi:hypothetical protein